MTMTSPQRFFTGRLCHDAYGAAHTGRIVSPSGYPVCEIQKADPGTVKPESRGGSRQPGPLQYDVKRSRGSR